MATITISPAMATPTTPYAIHLPIGFLGGGAGFGGRRLGFVLAMKGYSGCCSGEHRRLSLEQSRKYG